MRRLLIFLTLSLLQAATAAPQRPNIVLILADDLGWKDVGFNGSAVCETPNLDRLAKEALIFSQAYAGAGNCAPSRACLISGNVTPRHGVYAVGSTDRGPKKFQRLVSIPNKSGLAKENVTIADAMKTAGYATGIFGKWHLDGPDGAEPGEQGFEVVFDSQKGDPNKKRDRPEDPKGIFSITREANSFIEKNAKAGKPFFAYVSHHAIHSAHEARPASLAKFKDKGLPGNQAIYAACTYDLDASVGMVVEKLKELGIEKNTLVIFTSDNGGTGELSQEPLRGDKGGYYEGGIREPFFALWPGTIAAGISHVPIINEDFYPTFLALAEAKAPAGKTLDGTDLLPLLKGKGEIKRDSLFWDFPGYLNTPVNRGRESDVKLKFRTRPVSVIRKGDWKLHLFHEEWVLDGGLVKISENRAVELYNLKTDPGEHTDLAKKETAKRDELLKDLLAWRKQLNAPMPQAPNPDYDPQAAAKALAQ